MYGRVLHCAHIALCSITFAVKTNVYCQWPNPSGSGLLQLTWDFVSNCYIQLVLVETYRRMQHSNTCSRGGHQSCRSVEATNVCQGCRCRRRLFTRTCRLQALQCLGVAELRCETVERYNLDSHEWTSVIEGGLSC